MSFIQRLKAAGTAFVMKQANDPVTAQAIAEAMWGGYETNSGKQVSSAQAMRVSAVFACVRLLSEQIGMLPCVLYSGDEDEKTKNRAKDHTLYNLLHKAPNKYMTAQEFWEAVIVALCFKGNFYAYIQRGAAGRIIGLLPLNNGSVQPRLLDDWTPVYQVSFHNGQSGLFGQDEIWHVRGISSDGLLGMSPIRYAREAIGLSLATEEHGARLFSNGAVTSGVLRTDQTLSDEAFKRLKEDFKDRHQGVSNAQKPMILEMGLDWKQTSLNADDAQFLETRKFQVAEIARLFLVPPHMIGDLEKATFSNIEQQSIDFAKNTLTPYLERIEQRIKVGLLKKSEQSGFYAKFDITRALRGDQESRYKGYATGINWGILNPNECRAKEDLPPREGGDDYLTPLNMTTDSQQETEQPAGDQDAETQNL